MSNEHKRKLDQFKDRWEKAKELLERGELESAIFLFTRLADDACSPALSMLGSIYENGGKNLERDFLKAESWYLRSIEVLDDIDSHCALARIYLLENSDICDHKKALYHLELLEYLDKPGINFGLGIIYSAGKVVPENPEKAKVYFKKAGDQGHLVAKLQYFSLVPDIALFDFCKTWVIYIWVKLFNPMDWRICLAI